MKIVVSGATSFIGIPLIKNLLKGNHEVIGLCRPNSINRMKIDNIGCKQIIEIDSADLNELCDETTEKYDCFIHLAWDGSRAIDRNNKLLQEKNYYESILAFETALKLGCSIFLGVGSQAEYGCVDGAIHEDTYKQPISAYGIVKNNIFYKLSEYSGISKIRFVWTRLFSVYGPNDYEHTLIQSTVKNMIQNNDIDFTQCTQLWDFIYVEDVAEIIKKLIEDEKCSGPFNIASGHYEPLYNYIFKIYALTNSTSRLHFGVRSYGPEGKLDLKPDISRICKELNWTQKTSFIEGIKRVIEHEKLLIN